MKNSFTLITGASGFVGTMLLKHLSLSSRKIIVIGRNKLPGYINFNLDLSKEVPKLNDYSINEVYHLAGLAHQYKSYTSYDEYYDANVNATKNLLKAINYINNYQLKILFLSSVSVYGIIRGIDIPETHPKLATDNYGKTKALAEDLIIEFCKNNCFSYTIIRPPLIIGENPKGNLERLIKSISKNRYFSIKNNYAIKSVVALDDLVEYFPKIINTCGIFNLTDRTGIEVNYLEDQIVNFTSAKKPFIISYKYLYYIAFTFSILECLIKKKLFFNKHTLAKLTSTLTFCDKNASSNYDWNPLPVKNRISELLKSKI